MDFDLEKFRKAKYAVREKTLKLRNFGDGEETVEWTVRGLNAEELAKVDTDVQMNKELAKFLDLLAVATCSADEKAALNAKTELLKSILGLTDSVPDILVRQYSIFQQGSVSPKFSDRADAVKFAAVHPIEFNRIANEVYALTGMGKIAKKKLDSSGHQEKSETT